jgi:hypothetical protein
MQSLSRFGRLGQGLRGRSPGHPRPPAPIIETGPPSQRPRLLLHAKPTIGLVQGPSKDPELVHGQCLRSSPLPVSRFPERKLTRSRPVPRPTQCFCTTRPGSDAGDVQQKWAEAIRVDVGLRKVGFQRPLLMNHRDDRPDTGKRQEANRREQRDRGRGSPRRPAGSKQEGCLTPGALVQTKRLRTCSARLYNSGRREYGSPESDPGLKENPAEGNRPDSPRWRE